MLETVMPNWVKSAGVMHAAAPAAGVVHETLPCAKRVWKIQADRGKVGVVTPSGIQGAGKFAGAKKFAFHVPDGFPGIMEAGGKESFEDPAIFPTAWFSKRQNALDWFKKP